METAMTLMVREHDSLKEKIGSLSWYHQIDFGNGLISPGVASIEVLAAQADVYFRDGMAGKTMIDIGCWDGFNSVEASKRGATRVLATDQFAWSDKCWGSRQCFELAREHIAPNIDAQVADVFDLTPETVGTFDVVLFAGVFYHLRHPFLALERVSKLAKEMMIVETHVDALDEPRPAMIFYPGSECANDNTNWWGPNLACVEAMLKDVGFPKVEYTAHPIHANRAIFHARR
jgi:tRNA (mo5U34)-methyltransferase